MIITILRIIISALIVLGVYYFGEHEGKKKILNRKKTRLYLGEKCDGCKRIKPTISNLEHDRFGKVTGVCIGCAKNGSCKGRRDEKQ